MDTIKKLGLIALIGISSFCACEKSDLRPDDAAVQTKEMTAVLPWEIVSFQWHNKAENDHFVGYKFQFNDNGSLMVNHDNIKEYGRWSRKGNILQIEFQTAPLNELNNNWTVVEQTRDHMSLKGLSPYDHTSEMVEFHRVHAHDPN